MISQEVLIKNKAGLHARPASVFSKTAAIYPCKVSFQKGDRAFNGKSIVSVLSACVTCGTSITIVCEGEREEEALRAIVSAVENGLGE